MSALAFLLNNDIEYDIYDNNDNDDIDQVGKVSALAFLLNGSETELFLCEEGAVKITLGRFYQYLYYNDDNCHDHHPLYDYKKGALMITHATYV